MSYQQDELSEIELRLIGYRLATAEILYRMPDHPTLLQTFLWQALDLAPKFPVLTKFLTFWETNLDGPIHSVRLASAALINPAELRNFDDEFRLH